jgi:acetyl-CoA acetyltransferase
MAAPGSRQVWRSPLPEQAIRDKTAIAGIGWTEFTKSSGTSVLNLASEACLKAIDDAGIAVEDVDGLVTYGWESEYERQVYPEEVARALGLEGVNYQLFEILGGGQSCAYVASAAMAVYSGLCKNVIVFRAANRYSDRTVRGVVPASGRRQWLTPVGCIHPAASYGPHVVAHMERYGTTSEDMGRLAVEHRRHATLNKKSMMKSPLTIEEHQLSPWIVYPFRLLDCCLNTDGAVAVLVTSSDRAKDMRHAPVQITSIMSGALGDRELWETNAERAAPILYGAAGISVGDLDFAQLYDPFTGICMLHIEGFGLTAPGTSGAWIAEGQSGLDGATPVNTHGGLLSESYFMGLNHVIEAVQQLRPEGVIDDYCDGEHDYDRAHCRQVRDAQVGLVCGEFGLSSLILRRA